MDLLDQLGLYILEVFADIRRQGNAADGAGPEPDNSERVAHAKRLDFGWGKTGDKGRCQKKRSVVEVFLHALT